MGWMITNDDGIDAPGLRALEAALELLGKPATMVIAPAGPCSGCGHQVTTGQAFRLEERDSRRVAVHGQPADCVRAALGAIFPQASLVLSGINAGGNLGADVYHSGTVAAAREAVLHGVPGIAVSQYIARGRLVDWNRSARLAAMAIASLQDQLAEPGLVWNINLPHPEEDSPDPQIVHCAWDPSPLPLTMELNDSLIRYRGDYQSRPRRPGHDVDLCFQGAITITALRLGC